MTRLKTYRASVQEEIDMIFDDDEFDYPEFLRLIT